MKHWKTAWFCANCHIEMTYNIKMYSNGRCPGCGHKANNAGSIVKTYEKGYQFTRPWWKFWVSKYKNRIWMKEEM